MEQSLKMGRNLKPDLQGLDLDSGEGAGREEGSLQSGAVHEAGRFSGLPLPGV